ncbi:MlaD family protein [Halothiobacillus sp.]|uniref:MlaD family protein n=1 Tax=Halothiobacillus sp. TaxID=1891311 RepID=UPI002624E953|nr:MlaD family protein [Halothiobacillus sp.]
MDSKINYTAVGLFVLLLGLGLAATAYWLVTGGKQQSFTPYVIYATDSVAGLTVNSHVLYRGVDVGEVKEIRIDENNPGRIRIRVDIDAKAPIRADTVAELRPQGVTGLSVLNLTGGKSNTPLLQRTKNGELVIPYEPSIFSRLEGGLSDTMVKITSISDRLDQLFSEKNIAIFDNMLQNINGLTTVLAEHQTDISAAIIAGRKTLENTAVASQSANTLIMQSQMLVSSFNKSIQGLKSTLDAANEAANKVSAASDNTIAMTQTGNQTLNNFNQRTLPVLDGLLSQLQETSVALTRLVNQLNDNPSQILYGAAPIPPGPGEGKTSASPNQIAPSP